MAEGNHNDAADVSNERRLVLCFDGTGNKFSGNTSDTNIVKLYQRLDRKRPEQFHYYQPGIGTYSQKQAGYWPVGLFTKLRSYTSTIFDLAIGTSFEVHVIAGYRFIMRYYSPDDAIYIFGFSRGAYTARFLAEMVQTIGLLSQGNEEMVRFAWNTFSKFEEARGRYPKTEEDEENIKFMNDFKSTFCREGVVIHFLGLFDCVNSLGQFDIPIWRINYRNIAMPAATHIRHAVSIHERRLKFKPALFVQDQLQGEPDIKEFWFAGNHGDVGGGWEKPRGQMNQLSDTPLEWMVQELLNLKDTPNKLSFKTTNVRPLETRESDLERSLQRGLTNHEKLTLDMKPHDMLRFGGGAPWYRVMGWWIIEFLPFQTRLKLIDGEWIPRHWPPNMGASRDIPKDADFHPTFKEMCKAGLMEMPKVGGDIEYPRPKP